MLTILLLLLVAAFIFVMRRIMRRDNYINELILAFLERGEISKEELLDKMYEYGCNDFRLKKVIAKHQATRKDYETVFDKIFHWANFKRRRRYLPINSFFFVSSLDYILGHKDEDAKKLATKMMNHFHF